jgi:hypothetical protein
MSTLFFWWGFMVAVLFAGEVYSEVIEVQTTYLNGLLVCFGLAKCLEVGLSVRLSIPCRLLWIVDDDDGVQTNRSASGRD